MVGSTALQHTVCLAYCDNVTIQHSGTWSVRATGQQNDSVCKATPEMKSIWFVVTGPMGFCLRLTEAGC